jgi:di/tricarboxylate transporter
VTLQQGLGFGVIAGMLILFVWGRWRYDIVALLALLASVACGVVPANRAFNGFSNPLLPLIASALVVSAAIGKSGVIDMLVRPMMPLLRGTSVQVFALTAAVAFLSALVKNVGALAIFLPVAMQVARRNGRSPSELLMPLSFGSLLGGMMTLIGTSPNLIASSLREQLLGRPFSMFDFLPVGLGLTLVGVTFVGVGWRLIPRGRKGQGTPETLFRVEDYVAEVRVPPNSPYVGRTVAELEALAQGDMAVTAIIREGFRRYVPSGNWTLFADDVLALECDPQVLDRVATEARLELVGSQGVSAEALRSANMVTLEAVITNGSPMIGLTPIDLHLRERYGINLLAVSQRGRPMSVRLRRVRFQVGDVVVLQGNADSMPDTLAILGCLPLAERRLALGQPRNLVLPVLLLGGAVALAATDTVPVALAFTGAALLVALLRLLTLNEIYASIEWPILILLGSLIPVGEAIHDNGGTALIAAWLSHVAAVVPSWGVLAALIVITMLVTPILHHAAAVIVMGPIAVSLAARLGFHADPFLMAVAVGASCDFLTPIGHQCNTLVMGPGGYRFTDYWRLGLPLSCLVVVVGVPLIAFFWPLR